MLQEYKDDGVERLKPRESFGSDVHALSPYALSEYSFEHSDMICTGLEEMSRHLRRLDDEFRLCHFDRIEVRCRSIVRLSDQLGLRRVEQVAADVIYCLDGPDEVALSATLSRLMRLMGQALDHAAGDMSCF